MQEVISLSISDPIITTVSTNPPNHADSRLPLCCEAQAPAPRHWFSSRARGANTTTAVITSVFQSVRGMYSTRFHIQHQYPRAVFPALSTRHTAHYRSPPHDASFTARRRAFHGRLRQFLPPAPQRRCYPTVSKRSAQSWGVGGRCSGPTAAGQVTPSGTERRPPRSSASCQASVNCDRQTGVLEGRLIKADLGLVITSPCRAFIAVPPLPLSSDFHSNFLSLR